MITLKKVLLVLLTVSLISSFFSQGGVAISNSGNNPHPSAMLDVVSDNKGLLIPRLQLIDINDAATIPSADNSLLVFNLAPSGVAPDNVEEGFYYWDLSQTKWIRLVSGTITGTDDQKLDSITLNGSTLTVYLEDGGDKNIDLSKIIDSTHVYNEWKDSDTLGGAFTRDFVYASQAKSFGKDVVVTDSGFFAVGTFSPLFKMHLKVNGNSEVTNNSIAMTDVNVLGSRTSIGDATSSGAIYSPLFLGQAAGNDIAHTAITSQIDPSIDNGTTPVMVFTSKLNPSAIIQNRPLFQWRNEANPQMTMLANGNVGIGTGIPTSNLHVSGVNGNALSSTPILKLEDITKNGMLYIDDGQFSSVNHPNSIRIGSYNNVNPTLSVLELQAGFNSNQLLLHGNGNIGIGRETPNYKLDIIGTSRITHDSPTQTGLIFSDASAPIDAGASIGEFQAGLGLSSSISITNPEVFILNGVGINTVNQTNTLSVNGTANKPGGGAWAVFSDKKLKKNITNYSEGLSLIEKINTVNFQYNEKLEEIWGDSEQIKDKVFQGVIAQELREIAPDMVREVVIDIKDEKGAIIKTEKVLEVDPNKFTYALINAVKEQQVIIESQKEKISALETTSASLDKVEDLQSQINELKALISLSEK